MFVICHQLFKGDSDRFVLATFPRIDSGPSLVINCQWLVSDGFPEIHGGCCCCCFREVFVTHNLYYFIFAHCTLHTKYCTLHTEYCKLNNTHCTLHNVHCTLHTVHYTLHTELCTLHTENCTLNT